MNEGKDNIIVVDSKFLTFEEAVPTPTPTPLRMRMRDDRLGEGWRRGVNWLELN
jgi:hypothetical protein